MARIVKACTVQTQSMSLGGVHAWLLPSLFLPVRLAGVFRFTLLPPCFKRMLDINRFTTEAGQSFIASQTWQWEWKIYDNFGNPEDERSGKVYSQIAPFSTSLCMLAATYRRNLLVEPCESGQKVSLTVTATLEGRRWKGVVADLRGNKKSPADSLCSGRTAETIVSRTITVGGVDLLSLVSTAGVLCRFCLLSLREAFFFKKHFLVWDVVHELRCSAVGSKNTNCWH